MLGIIQFQIILWFFPCLCRFRPPTSVWRNVIFRQNLLSIDWTQLNQFNHSILVLIRASWTFMTYTIIPIIGCYGFWPSTTKELVLFSLYFSPPLSHTLIPSTHFVTSQQSKPFFLQFFLRIIFIWQEVDEILLIINFGNRRRSIPINLYLISRLVSIIIKIIVSVFHFFLRYWMKTTNRLYISSFISMFPREVSPINRIIKTIWLDGYMMSSFQDLSEQNWPRVCVNLFVIYIELS